MQIRNWVDIIKIIIQFVIFTNYLNTFLYIYRFFIDLEMATHLMKCCVCYLLFDFSIRVTGM